MTLADLDGLLEHLEHTAACLIVQDGHHAPMAFIVWPNRTILPITLPHLDETGKARLQAGLEDLARKGAAAFVLITEAWMALGPSASSAAAWIDAGRSLASFADRQEALTLVGACPAGQRLRVRPILRSPEGIQVGPPMALPEDGTLSSRFFDGLPWTPPQAATA